MCAMAILIGELDRRRTPMEPKQGRLAALARLKNILASESLRKGRSLHNVGTTSTIADRLGPHKTLGQKLTLWSEFTEQEQHRSAQEQLSKPLANHVLPAPAPHPVNNDISQVQALSQPPHAAQRPRNNPAVRSHAYNQRPRLKPEIALTLGNNKQLPPLPLPSTPPPSYRTHSYFPHSPGNPIITTLNLANQTTPKAKTVRFNGTKDIWRTTGSRYQGIVVDNERMRETDGVELALP
jgi:hypothetical protein